jgi:hypothetical protein
MKTKLIVRLSIISVYFFSDIIYTVWKNGGEIETNILIEKGLLFLGVGISVYLFTRKEFISSKKENTS